MKLAEKNSARQKQFDKAIAGRMNSRRASVNGDDGFSMIELLIVIGIFAIIIGFALFMFAGNRNAYRTDDEAFEILDYMRDASRRAIAQKRPMRLEIDLSSNQIRIISEVLSNDPPGTNPQVVRQDALQEPGFVRVDQQPSNITVTPPAPFGYPQATYATATYSVPGLSNSRNVTYLRFATDGSVRDQANNNISRTIYIWTPQSGSSNAAKSLDQVRAVTLFTGTGSARLWNYNSASSAFVGR